MGTHSRISCDHERDTPDGAVGEMNHLPGVAVCLQGFSVVPNLGLRSRRHEEQALGKPRRPFNMRPDHFPALQMLISTEIHG